ncbi:Upstream stimulatory factor 2, partial [Ophiophagus hannah]
HEKDQESEVGVELREGDGTNADEQTAVAIASVQQAAFADHNIQYQFRTENNGGQVTYRVVQVTDSQLDGQTDATGAAVIQNPFSNGGSPATDAVSGEARFAYFPASTVGDATAVSVQTTDQSLTQAGVLRDDDPPRRLADRNTTYHSSPHPPLFPVLERRRRDKINNWIVQLSKIIPDCNTDNTKTGASKGGILSKACDYIRELRQTNQRMQE